MNRRHFLASSLMLLGGTSFAGGSIINRLAGAKLAQRFAIASDGHFGQPETDYENFHNEMMTWLNLEHKASPLSFCIFNGDLIHDDPGLLPNVKAKYELLKFPYHVSRGNHDRCDKETWIKTWGRELNYTFEIEESAFIVLDTSNQNGDYLCPNFSFAEAEFKRLRRHKHVFVFMHIPPVMWNESFTDCKELVLLFSKQKNLRAIFHGHDHMSDTARFEHGKPFLFDGHLGGNWGTAYRGYRVVEIYSNGEILTYQVNPAGKIRVNQNSLR